jgi:ankyrin repeat protein
MQDGLTPAHEASRSGNTETLALILANSANVNASDEVLLFKIFNNLKSIHIVNENIN